MHKTCSLRLARLGAGLAVAGKSLLSFSGSQTPTIEGVTCRLVAQYVDRPPTDVLVLNPGDSDQTHDPVDGVDFCPICPKVPG